MQLTVFEFIGFIYFPGAQCNTIPEVITGRGFTGWRQNTRAAGGGLLQERDFPFFGLLRADPRNRALRRGRYSQIVGRHSAPSTR